MASWLSFHFVSNYFYFPQNDLLNKCAKIVILRIEHFNHRLLSYLLHTTWKRPYMLHTILGSHKAGWRELLEKCFTDTVLIWNRGAFPVTESTGAKKKKSPILQILSTEVYWTMYSKQPEKSCLSLQRYWKTFKCECQKARTLSWKRRAFKFFSKQHRVFCTHHEYLILECVYVRG